MLQKHSFFTVNSLITAKFGTEFVERLALYNGMMQLGEGAQSGHLPLPHSYAYTLVALRVGKLQKLLPEPRGKILTPSRSATDINSGRPTS